ncbi:MAG: proline iminopeptidase-family hydrolase, partial [Acidimicrobiales bacterium]
MSSSDTPVSEDFVPFREHRTWYRITGSLGGTHPPLIILHGGPGAAHDYVDRFKLLADSERAVIHYDQIGCGRSTHLPNIGPDFWTIELFLEELDNLLAHLGISGNYDLLGQSWGGMLAAEHAVRGPAGLRALIIANSPASMVTWVEEANRLRAELPPDVQKTLIEHEKTGTTDSVDYQNAVRVFYSRHLCRIFPWPDELMRSLDQIEADPTVYHTM